MVREVLQEEGLGDDGPEAPALGLEVLEVLGHASVVHAREVLAPLELGDPPPIHPARVPPQLEFGF